ncbi:unnamed protein product, partial [Trichobilharzia szidati]
VSAQIKNDDAYWGNCVIRAHLSDPDSPYEIFCRTTNEVYRLRRRQVSINETEVKNLRFQKLLPSNHVDPLVSPHCDSEVLRTNVGLPNSEENRKRRRKPKDFGADWIIPGNPRKRVKSDCIRVNDNNDLAGRLKGDEIDRGGKSLGRTTEDLFDEVPNQDSMRLSEPLNTHRITNELSSLTSSDCIQRVTRGVFQRHDHQCWKIGLFFLLGLVLLAVLQ